MAFKPNTPIIVMLLLLRFAALVYAVEDIRECWYPDGTAAPDDVPCYDTGASLCCGKGYICLSSGLCQTPLDILKMNRKLPEYIRGSCTDGTFTDRSCPHVCIDSDDILDGPMKVGKCNGTADVFYCINDNAKDEDKPNCEKNIGLFLFTDAVAVVTTIGVTTTTRSTSEKSKPTVDLVDVPTIATASDEEKATSTGSTLPAGGSSKPGSPEPTETSAANSAGQDSQKSQSVSKSTIIGGTIGGVAGLAMIVITVWWLLRRRRANSGEGSRASHARHSSQQSVPPYYDPNYFKRSSSGIQVHENFPQEPMPGTQRYSHQVPVWGGYEMPPMSDVAGSQVYPHQGQGWMGYGLPPTADIGGIQRYSHQEPQWAGHGMPAPVEADGTQRYSHQGLSEMPSPDPSASELPTSPK